MLVAVLSLSSGILHAGLTASQVIVVVNGRSFQSRTVANHFIALRQIPAQNVIVLPEVPNSEVIDVDSFRQLILGPVLQEIENRKLAGHAACITYSSDFPTGINIGSDLKDLENLHKIYTKRGSLTGLTYLYANVARRSPAYINMNANYYARRKIEDYFTFPGNCTLDEWNAIGGLIDQKDHARAFDELTALFEKQPYQFPIAYLAAAQAALADRPQEAIDWLGKAIAAGWTDGKFLEEDERFDSVRDTPDFVVQQYALQSGSDNYQPSLGFDPRISWTPNGVPTSDPTLGMRFMLSTMLAVTRSSGTTVNEAVQGLRRSAESDFSHPDGTFYFSVTSDVRSTTRAWGFLGATAELQNMGFKAELIRSALPKGKTDVLGLQTGTPRFRWAESRSEFVPGAIADNLTSFGGVMTSNSGQTRLTEFLRHGAAGSCGTVIEPYTIPEKFPLPHLYVHYARGASLAEAFYMSVAGPYQLLVVGDPLARPFAHPPKRATSSEMRTLPDDSKLTFDLDLEGASGDEWANDETKLAERTESLAAKVIWLLLDGAQPMLGQAKKSVSVSFNGRPPGFHELHVRLSADDALAQASESVMPIWLGSEDVIRIQAVGAAAKQDANDGRRFAAVSLQDSQLQLTVTAPNAVKIEILNQSEVIGTIDGDSGTVDIDLSKLGMGPLRLQARATISDDQQVLSTPEWIRIDP